jgi:ribosome recycling factor
MIQDDILTQLGDDIEQAVTALRQGLTRLRTGRANLSLLDGVRVSYYGTATPVAQCATLSVADARLITVKPWDRGIINDIERAIQLADIGLTPQNDGDIIRLPIPQLTAERRRDLVKQAKGRGEDAKVSVRNARRDANDMLKQAEKDRDLSEDDLKRALERVQEVTDQGVAQVDRILKDKEAEIIDV